MWTCVSIGVQEGPLPEVGEEEKEAINPSTELKNAAFRQGLSGCCEGTLLR